MKTAMQIQQENVAELLKLIAENPNLRIMPIVDYEVVADDGHAWWPGSFGSPRVDAVFGIGERLYLQSHDTDNLVDKEFDALENSGMAEELAEKKAEETVNNYEWERVIVVEISLP